MTIQRFDLSTFTHLAEYLCCAQLANDDDDDDDQAVTAKNLFIGGCAKYHLPNRSNYVAERTQDGDCDEINASAAGPPLGHFVYNSAICTRRKSYTQIHKVGVGLRVSHDICRHVLQ